ncbi:hypothetical protein M0R45_005906 [Rubus argutus]|uniref:Uncharacterized protein n=1 Tax=Rubus argutus TaxID=59490 RepID=A0AAW1YPD2_RUBAR
MSNKFSTVGTEDNVPGVSNDLLQKEVVALRISGHEKDQRLRIKDDAIKVENMFSTLMDDSEIEEEQEEKKREEETEKKQTEHGHARRKKKKKQTRRTSPASEGSGPDSQGSSIGVLSLPLVCFLILLIAICIH